jgi:hypothetical protein
MTTGCLRIRRQRRARPDGHVGVTRATERRSLQPDSRPMTYKNHTNATPKPNFVDTQVFYIATRIAEGYIYSYIIDPLPKPWNERVEGQYCITPIEH